MNRNFVTPHYIFIRRMPKAIIWGGLEKLMLEWFECIDYNRCRVTLVVTSGGGEIYTRYLKEKKLPVNVVEFPFRFDVIFFKRFGETFGLLLGLKPNKVVFCQGRFFCFDLAHVLAAYLTAGNEVYMHENLEVPPPSFKRSKKHLGIVPGFGLWWYSERYLTRLRAYFCKKIFVVSDEIRRESIDLWKYPPHKVEVLYHGVNVGLFKPLPQVKESMRRAKGLGLDETVIILASRLIQEKCVHRSIEAFDALWREDPHVRLLIAGTGPYEERLKELAASMPSKDKICFLGHVANMHEFYQMSDIYILSSDNEGLSLAFLEALASGLVCVTTKCTGTKEVIQDGINGFLVDKSTQGVREGLQKAFRLSGQERQSMSQNAVRFVNEYFEINRNVNRALLALGIPSLKK